MKSSAFTLITAISLALAASQTIADHNSAESLKKRVSSVGTLNIMTVEEAAAAAKQAAEAAALVAANSGPADGSTVYSSGCNACHDSGVAGAPKMGDAAAWQPRVAQGLEMLVEHALLGYQGEAGVMPAKGGNPALSDEDVAAAVEHMIEGM